MKLQGLKQWLQAEGFAGIPRWYFLLSLPIFYTATIIAVCWKWDSGQPIAVNLEKVAVLSGGGLFPWLLGFIHLHVEVLHMIFSKEVNRREVQRAVEQERAVAERERAVVERERALVERERALVERERAELHEWFKRNEARWPQDLEPPPGIDRNGHNNGAA